MDSSPAKRRKTSPTTAVAVSASNTTTRLASQDGGQTTPSRASFMSPTKASLARFNPSLLPRPKVAAGASRLGQTSIKQQSAHRVRKEMTGDGSAWMSQLTTPTREFDGPYQTGVTTMNARAATASPGRTIRSLGGGMLAAPRRRSHTPGRASSPMMTIRTTPEVNAAASPPEAAEEKTDTAQEIIDSQLEQELQDGIGRRRRRVATVDKAVNISYQAEPEELELRPTPTELGLEPPPERPKGLLFSSPSRRARKKRGASVKLSPLKLRDPPPEKSPEKKFGPRSKPAPLQQITKPVMDEAVSRKQKERDKLSRQLQRLQADVARLEGEVAKTQDPAPPDSRSQEEVDELLSILTTTNPAHKEIRPKIPQPPLSHRLSLFLPFFKQPLPPPSAAPSSTSPLPSHHPLALTDPLPHLRVFTPLTISSTDTLLPSTTPSAPLIQRHNITLASPQNLLNVKLSLTANTTTGTVDNLDVVALAPWAIPELRTWIRKRALDGDVSSIGWAIGRYWEVAQLRAKCWGRCERDHPDLVAHKGHNAGKSKGHEKPALPKRRRRSRKENQIQGDDERADGDNNDDDSVTAESLSRHHILPHLGRTSLLFQRDAISLLISWRIDFDWTGEVQSHVAASAAFPDSWERTDERHSLRKVGPLFQKLVQLKGVRGAVGVLVGLVFGG